MDIESLKTLTHLLIQLEKLLDIMSPCGFDEPTMDSVHFVQIPPA
jgi:hypothetical protein